MPSLPLAKASAAKTVLKEQLDAAGVPINRVVLHVRDDGLGLLVYAPTDSHPKIPQEFDGFKVSVREPLPHMHGWGCGTSCFDKKKSDDPV